MEKHPPLRPNPHHLPTSSPIAVGEPASAVDATCPVIDKAQRLVAVSRRRCPDGRPARRAPILAGMGAKGCTMPWRGLALLAVLVGLVAMHGLGGTQHHTAPPQAAVSLTASTHHVAHAVVAAGHSVHGAVQGAVDATGEQLAAACHDTCSQSGAAALCLAVLTTAAAALVAAGRTRVRRAEPASAVRLASAVRAPPRPPFDLVADLCISRT